jgi:hypothetical protein
MKIKIGSKTFVAALEDNATATAFKALLPLTADMSELNGNEKHFKLPGKLPTSASNPGTIHSGSGSNEFFTLRRQGDDAYSREKPLRYALALPG